MCFIFHKWSKWEEFDKEVYHVLAQIKGEQSWQRRVCEKCGLIQEKKI